MPREVGQDYLQTTLLTRKLFDPLGLELRNVLHQCKNAATRSQGLYWPEASSDLI